MINIVRENYLKMKEHPILFQTEMVQAILKGRKVMTRRVIKESFNGCLTNGGPHPCPNDPVVFHPGEIIPSPIDGEPDMVMKGEKVTALFHCSTLDSEAKCPYGKIGDTLWVRETWSEHNGEYAYKASLDLFKQTNWYKEIKKTFDFYNAPLEDNCIKWRPSIFMPRAASRITLKITNIKVERVQDISEEDAIKEGVQPTSYCAGCGRISGNCDCPAGTITEKTVPLFKSLWIKINGQESWDSNPFCWCVQFEKL